MLSSARGKMLKAFWTVFALSSVALPSMQSGKDSVRKPAFAAVPEVLRNQIQSDVMGAIEKNHSAKTYGDYSTSGYTAKDVFSNIRELRDSNAWAALCQTMDALPPENLALFEEEITRPANESQLDCAPALRGKLTHYWEENAVHFRQHLTLSTHKHQTPKPASLAKTAEHKVSIAESPFVTRAGIKSHEIALTFNDGPDPNRTPRILDVLKASGVRATFFHVGEKIRAKPEIDHRLVDEKHTLGTHTFGHVDLSGADLKKSEKQIVEGREEAEAASGVDAPFFRAPYGLLNDNVKDMLKKRKMPVFESSIDSLDWKIRDESSLFDHILQAIEDQKGGILNLHETQESSVAILHALIDELKGRGYTFVIFVPAN